MKQAILLFLSVGILFSCSNKKEKKDPEPVTGDNKDTVTIPINKNTGINYMPVDLSPMDMSYYPVDYPKLKMTKTPTVPPQARVIYSRPQLQGRQLFHDVLQYGEPWRLGANEATELDLYTAVTIQGKRIAAGRYIIYCIPEKNNWTIVLNSNIDSWGLHPNPSSDIARFSVPIKETGNAIEYFTMIFEPQTEAVNLLMAWGNVEARLPISFLD